MPANVPMLDLARQYAAIGEECQAAVAAVFREGRFILGREVAGFEQASAQALGAKHGIATSSGTDALWLALAAAGVQRDDKVVTTPFSFFATASAIARCEARPVFADIDPKTFNLCPHAVEEALMRHPEMKFALPVHLYGQCADFDALNALKRKHGLRIVEDAAQAFGASWNGTPAGSLGDAAAFSFYPTKNLSAWGDAGLVTANDDAIADRAKVLHVHGMRVRYFHETIGWNARMDTAQAAVLLIKLRYIAQWNEQRKAVAERYHQLFRACGLQVAETLLTEDAEIALPWTDPRAGHVWHQYVVRCKDRDALRAHLTAHGIGSEIYYPLSLHQQEALTYLGYAAGDFPHSEQAAREVLALPIFPELREEEQQRVVETVAKFYKA